MKKMLFTAVMLLVAVMANAKDIKTVVLTTDPIMHCANCEAKIKDNLKYCKGIKSIETSVENQTVTIQYDADKTSPAAFVQSLKKANYVATEKKACNGECKGEHKCAGEQESCCKEQKHEGCKGECKGEHKCAGEQESCCKEQKHEGCKGECKGECNGECKHHSK